MSDSIKTINKLYHRDLDRLSYEITEIPDKYLWQKLPGVINTCGVLTQHLIGNLQHFIGKELGGTNYVREREREFTNTGISKSELLNDINELKNVIATVLLAYKPEDLDTPSESFPYESSVQEGLMHLYGHLNYHLGQVNYLRRMIGKKG